MSRTKYAVIHAINLNACSTIVAFTGTLKECHAWIAKHTAPWGVYRIRCPF